MMDGGDIAWTVGASVIGGVVGPLFQMMITKDRPAVHIGGNNYGNIDQGDHRINVRVSTSVVFEQILPPAPPRRERTTDTRSTSSSSDTSGAIIGMIVAAVILAVLYARYEEIIVRVLIVTTAFAAVFLLTSLIYLITRGVTFDAALIVELILLACMVVTAAVSIYFLTDPPGFDNGVGTYAELVATFQAQGSSAINSQYGLSGVGFLLYQLLGAAFTAALSVVIIFVSLKIMAITDLAIGANASWFRVFFARAGGKPGGWVAVGVFLAIVAGAASSGWLYALITSNSSNLIPGPSTVPTSSVVEGSTATVITDSPATS